MTLFINKTHVDMKKGRYDITADNTQSICYFTRNIIKREKV